MTRTRNSGDPGSIAGSAPPDGGQLGYAALDATERRLIRRAAAALPAMVLSLRLFGFQRTLGWLRRSARRSRGAATEAPLEQARRIAQLVELANRRYSPLAASCLPRSLALAWLLHRQGLDNELKIGVRSRSGGLQAHAWVEVGGSPLSEVEDVRTAYAAFDLPPGVTRLLSE